MLNLLYEPALKAACPDRPMSFRLSQKAEDNVKSDIVIHWYGKSTGQAGRKMGHLTATTETTEQARDAAQGALEQLKQGRESSTAAGAEEIKG